MKRYLTDSENRKNTLSRASKKKFLKESYNENLDINKNRGIQVSIDGEVYDSVSHASRMTGLSESSIHKSIKKLDKSSRSSMEFEIKTAKTYEFKKIK